MGVPGRSADRGNAGVRFQRPPARRARERRLPGQRRTGPLRPRAVSGRRLRDRLRVQEILHGRVDRRARFGRAGRDAGADRAPRPRRRGNPGAMKRAAIQPAPGAFVPEFGPRGELRQTIGESGRAHLDRWLPFLVLHRTDDPESSLARRVAVNSPGYLIWSPQEDEEAAEALRAIAAVLRDRLGPILLIDVEDAPWQAQPEDAPRLPPFVVRIGAAGGNRVLRALDALSEACGEVEVDLRRATVDAAAEPVLS